jgi:DNA-binding SARP family transcriptional activator
LDQAVQLYEGPFLDGSYADWALEERRTLEDQFVDACSRLAWLRLSGGARQDAIRVAERGLGADNSIEELHEIVVRALLALDRRGEAMRHVAAYSQYLHEELGASLPAGLKEILSQGAGTRPRQPAALTS